MADLTQFTNDVKAIETRLRAGLKKINRDYNWRIDQLKALERLIRENDKAISDAMWKDLRKSTFECSATEQGVVLSEINDTLKNLKCWMKPRKVKTPLYNQIGFSKIVHEPLGLTVIIGAWNYPINLLLAPLVGAIAGGNAAILKPSEMAANTAALIANLIPKYMDPDLFAVVLGGADETGILMDRKFDLIFFTGSGPVGKIMLAKAAPYLTPVILELGGKSPAIVAEDADLVVTARRIAWGKFMNAGQTCIAPDYVIMPTKIRDQFVDLMKSSLKEFYGENPQKSPDYCRIINTRNFDRLVKLSLGTDILHGGQTDKNDLYIAPTIVSTTPDSPIMHEEIFGPYLPILTIDDHAEIINFINGRPKPLALYVFTRDNALAERYVSQTTSGAVVVNDVVMHMPEPSLPFGGVGDSGMGNYHGEFSFKTFTHAKGVVKKWTRFDVPVRYAPYNNFKARVLRFLFS